MRCRQCGRSIEQGEEKALGEAGPDRFQVVWADRDGDWVCPVTKDEHEPGECTVWWHAFGRDIGGIAMLIIVGPTPAGPDNLDLNGTTVKEASLNEAPYLKSFNYLPSDEEKLDLEDSLLEEIT